VNELERKVLRLIGEDPSSPDVFLDTPEDLAPIRDSLNDAIAEVAMLTGGYTEQYDLPLLASRGIYRLHWPVSSFLWVREAWLQGNRLKLTRTSLEGLEAIDPKWLETDGSPRLYTTIGFDWLVVYPRPSATNDVVRLTAVCVPERYATDGARIKVRPELQQGLVHYAVSEYYAGRGDAQRAGLHWGLYAKHLGHVLGYPRDPERRVTLHTDGAPSERWTGARPQT
jgi:hypothetical protein